MQLLHQHAIHVAAQERSGGPVRVGDPGARTPHRIRDGLDGLALPYEPLAESLLHVQQLLGLTLQHPPDGDPRPGRDDLGDVGLGDLVGDHAGGVRVGFLRVDELLLDDGDLPVQQLRGAPQVAGALRLVGLHAQRVDLFLEVADPVQPGLLLLPAGLQTAQLLLGVGKTELAKSLADFLFDDETAMVRIDMSEYSEKHSVARLVGAPPGYVGYEEGGQLTEAVRRRPYSVILLDEVEKAHPDLFNILLQVLDDGRLTDGQGRTVDFRNTILILTSNLGSQYLADPLMSDGEKREQVMGVVRSAFRPEFLNRLDDIVMFEPLTREDLRRIVAIQLERLGRRLASRRITVEVTDAAADWLGEVGFDPVYGARPLRRLVQTTVEDQLARGLLSGQIHDGEAVRFDRVDDGIALV